MTSQADLKVPNRQWKTRAGRLFMAGVFYLLLAALLAGCDSRASGSSGDRIKLVITPVPSPTTTPLAAPTAAPTTYTVRSGDTLSGIAALFGVAVDDIVRANNIADPNALAEGQVLTIPVRSALSTPTSTPGASASGTPSPVVSPTLPPPDVTPPLGPTTTDPTRGVSSSPGLSISPTAEP